MGQLGHPYASQVKASVRRRLRALGATAGKSYGKASMDLKSSYPATHAGTERPKTIAGGTKGIESSGKVSGKSGHRRADHYARGGKIKGRGAKHVTNVVIGAHPPAAPQDRPLPVPIPVGGGGPPVIPPRPVGPPPAGGPPALPPGAAPGLPMRPPGMKSGGSLSPHLSPEEEYHNWGKGYKHGGHVKKKAGGGMLRLEEKDASGSRKGYSGYPHSPTKEVEALSATKRGGAVKKRARGGHVESEAHEKKERKLLGEMVKLEKAEHKAHGGAIKKAHGGGLTHAGSGSGEGRLEKSRMARKVPAHTEA